MREPCPMCDGLTEDPYGGPCSACWDLDEEEQDRKVGALHPDWSGIFETSLDRDEYS